MEAISVDQPGQQAFNDSSTFMERESWTSQQLQDYQARALSACRAYAYAHSPFYQRFHRGLMDRPLQDLPVLTKAMIMEHFDDLVTDRAVQLSDVQQYLAQADASKLFLDRYVVMATSGSSGQPGVFLLDRRVEGASMGNSYIRCLHWGGVTPESRAAVVTTTDPAQFTTQAPIMVNGKPVPRLQLSSYDPLETLVQRLNEWQPDTLFPYPSIASILANEQREGRLHITPRTIFCGAETLTDEMRRRIEKVWQTKLFNVYATTESGVLAMDCELHHGLHLFEDFTILEVVDQDNRPVPPGEPGAKVLLTVLFRRAQPLIRYEVSDVVRLSRERCACGRPLALVEAIEGRMAEVLYLLSSTGKEEAVPRFLFEFIIDTLPVSGWQVIQEPDGLHIFLTGASEELRDEHLLDALRQGLTKRGVIVPAIEIHRVTTLTRNALGKAPMLISHVPRRAS